MWSPDPETIITAEQKAAEAQARLIEQFRVAIQTHVDETAKARNYDSGVSLASYTSSTNPVWASEAAAFVAWRDAVWAYAYAELDKVIAGEREAPTISDFIAELTPVSWPE